MKFKVGDKVRVRKDLEVDKWYGDDSVVDEMLQMRGKEVTISRIINSEYKILEDFGGWCWTDEMFEPKCDRKILITSDGTETLARLYDGKKVIKTATANRLPEDVFDFATGAKLAFARLIGEDKPEPEKKPEPKPLYYNGKVVCVKGYADYWTVGKVYEFVDGAVVCDKGQTLGGGVRCFDDISKQYSAQFIPFVEDKPSFDWEGFKAGKFAVHCDTEEKAKAFLNKCAEQGIKWNGGEDIHTETLWKYYKHNTCYRCDEENLWYSPKWWYKKQGIKIIPYR